MKTPNVLVRGAGRLALVLGAVAILGGCMQERLSLQADKDPGRKPEVVRADRNLVLSLKGAKALTPQQLNQVKDMVAGFGDPTRAHISIAAPRAAAQPVSLQLTRMAIGLGVARPTVKVGGEPTQKDTVIVTSSQYLIKHLGCPDRQHELMDDGTYRNTSDFGCANLGALAGMMEDPADLVEPAGANGSPAAPVIDMLDQYNKGVAPKAADSGTTTGSIGK